MEVLEGGWDALLGEDGWSEVIWEGLRSREEQDVCPRYGIFHDEMNGPSQFVVGSLSWSWLDG